MARFFEGDERYFVETDGNIGGRRLDDQESQQVRDILTKSDISQASPLQVTADQDDYSLPDGELIRFSTDAARTITGFAGARAGLIMVTNVGSNNLIIANDSASSAAENRLLIPNGVNITLNGGANEGFIMRYDFVSLRWRIAGYS